MQWQIFQNAWNDDADGVGIQYDVMKNDKYAFNRNML